MTIATRTNVNVQELDALLATAREKGLSGERTLADFQWFLDLSRDGLDELRGTEQEDTPEETPTDILSLVPTGALTLDVTDGTQIIAHADEVFKAWIDGDFRNYGADEKSGPTLETPVAVYEMAKDATFKQMFTSLGAPREKLCLTQSQIIGYVQKHREHLRKEGYATLFLFKSNGKFFVAGVRFHGSHLEVFVRQFEYDRVLYAGLRPRVVVPQLETL